MSAIREEDAEPIKVLFTLHNNMNALDFVGPLEVLGMALNNVKDEGECQKPRSPLPYLIRMQRTKLSTANSSALAKTSCQHLAPPSDHT